MPGPDPQPPAPSLDPTDDEARQRAELAARASELEARVAAADGQPPTPAEQAIHDQLRTVAAQATASSLADAAREFVAADQDRHAATDRWKNAVQALLLNHRDTDAATAVFDAYVASGVEPFEPLGTVLSRRGAQGYAERAATGAQRIFPLTQLMACLDPMADTYHYTRMTFVQASIGDEAEWTGKIHLPTGDRTWAGLVIGLIDEPTELIVLTEQPDGKLYLTYRITMIANTAEAIALVTNELLGTNPVHLLGLDSTGVGLTVARALSQVRDGDMGPIAHIHFQELAEEGSIEAEAPHGQNILDFSTELLRGLVSEGQLVLPESDDDVINQLSRHTRAPKPAVPPVRLRWVYSHEPVPVFNALRLAVYARHLAGR